MYEVYYSPSFGRDFFNRVCSDFQYMRETPEHSNEIAGGVRLNGVGG